MEYPNTIDAKASRFAPLTKSKPNVVGSIWEEEARERADDVFCIKNVEAKRTLLRRGIPQHYRYFEPCVDSGACVPIVLAHLIILIMAV